MKKLLYTAAAVFALSFANAQEESGSAYKPSKGTLATEVSLNGGLNNANFGLNQGALKFRYFLNDDMALRVGLGTSSNKDVEVDDSNPSDVETETFKNASNTFNVGIEKHFAGAERLSTYGGADLLLRFSSASYEFKDNSGTFEIDGQDTNGNNAGSAFGLRVFTGADYYITKKVFLGVEAGISFLSEKNKDVTVSSTGSPSVTSKGPKSSGLATAINGGVRIGYQF
jgi:outer membrane protein W